MIDPRYFYATNSRPLTDALKKEWIDTIDAENKKISNSWFHSDKYTAIDWYSSAYENEKVEFLFRPTAAWKVVLKNLWFILMFIFYGAFLEERKNGLLIASLGILVLAIAYTYYHRKFTRENWRFSVSKQGFRFNDNRNIRGLDFKDVLCIFHKTSSNENNVYDNLAIYYALEGNRYEYKEVQLDNLNENAKEISQIVNFYWQKHLKN